MQAASKKIAPQVPKDFPAKLRQRFGDEVRLAYFPDEGRFSLMYLNRRTRLWERMRPWASDEDVPLPLTQSGIDYIYARVELSDEALRHDAEVDRHIRDHEQRKQEKMVEDARYRAKNNYKQLTADRPLKKRVKAKPIISLPPKGGTDVPLTHH